MGLDIASFSIMELSLRSPDQSLYEFPASPCCLRHFSRFFGLNHTQFSTLHAHATMLNKTTLRTTLKGSMETSFGVREKRKRDGVQLKEGKFVYTLFL